MERIKFARKHEKYLKTLNMTNNQKKVKSFKHLHPLLPPIAVRAMGMNENYSHMLDENMALIESPLIAPANSHFRQHYKTALYPYNITNHAGVSAANDHDFSENGDSDRALDSVENKSRYQGRQMRN